MLIECKGSNKKWNMQIYPTKIFIFVCESFILAHRLDGFLMGSTIDNN